jgi:hypothetical protein
MNNKKIKVITYIDRFNVLSDTFINYYLNFFNSDEFHFLILDSEFSSVRDYLLSKNFSEKNFESVKNRYYGTVNDILSLQNEVLNRFLNQGFIVVYVDIDEIIYHHDLKNYILTNIKDYITPSGIILIPNQHEDHLNPDHKILDQRGYCIFDNTWYSKTCILNKKYVWSGGRHNKNTNKIYEDIFLIDIGKSCPKLMLENNKMTNKIYKNVSFKYSTENESVIEKMISKSVPLLKPLPNYITNKKLF